MTHTTYPTPKWLLELPEKEQERARQVFAMRIAALYASREGTIMNLSLACGYNQTGLASYAHTSAAKKLPIIAAKRIEATIGRDIMPREILCTYVFPQA
jgi:hypothetical protein